MNMLMMAETSTSVGIATAAACIAASYVYYKSKKQTSTIPYAPGKPLIGNLIDLGNAQTEGSLLKLIDQWSKDLGDIFFISIPMSPILVISDGAQIRRALNDANSFGIMDSLSASAEPLMGTNNVFISMDEMHRQQRKIVSGAFVPGQMRVATKKIEEMCLIFQEKIDSMIENSEEIDAQAEFIRLTVDIIGAMAFDMNFGTIKNGSKFLEDLTIALEGGGKRMLVPKKFWPYVFRDNSLYYAACETLRQIPKELIENRLKQGIEQDDMRDLLQRLLDAKCNGKENLSDEEIINNTMLFFLAGHETVSHTLCWVFYELTQHPEIVEKIREEVDRVLTPGVDITYEILNELKYTESVAKETLRMHPTAPMLMRRARKDLEINGHKVKEGTSILLNSYSCHRSDKNFPDALLFKPERWLDESTTTLNYFPFGGGFKMCIGMKLALAELRLITAMLVQRYDISRDLSLPVKQVLKATLQPDGKYPLIFKKRVL